MESTTLPGVFETPPETEKSEVFDDSNMARENAQRENAQKERNNRAFLAKLDRADEQIRTGRVVVKTMEELEAMAQ